MGSLSKDHLPLNVEMKKCFGERKHLFNRDGSLNADPSTGSGWR